MLPAQFYEIQKNGKAQARWMGRKSTKPATIRVDTWLGGYRYLFPETRLPKVQYDQTMLLMPFRREFGRELMSEFTAIQAQGWALSHPSHVRLLRQAWKKAVVMGVAPFNVWLVVEKAPRRKEKVRAPSDEELFRILMGRPISLVGESAQTAALRDFYDLILAAAYSGARQAGLLRVKAADVDLEAGRMIVTEKGEKTRTVVLCGPSRAAVARQVERKRLYPPGRPLWDWKASAVQKKWRDVRGEFPHGFHSLRHFCATWMAEQGIAPLDIAVQLGHVDSAGRPYTRMLEKVYTHPGPERALERIEQTVKQGASA